MDFQDCLGVSRVTHAWKSSRTFWPIFLTINNILGVRALCVWWDTCLCVSNVFTSGNFRVSPLQGTLVRRVLFVYSKILHFHVCLKSYSRRNTKVAFMFLAGVRFMCKKIPSRNDSCILARFALSRNAKKNNK